MVPLKRHKPAKIKENTQAQDFVEVNEGIEPPPSIPRLPAQGTLQGKDCCVSTIGLLFCKSTLKLTLKKDV